MQRRGFISGLLATVAALACKPFAGTVEGKGPQYTTYEFGQSSNLLFSSEHFAPIKWSEEIHGAKEFDCREDQMYLHPKQAEAYTELTLNDAIVTYPDGQQTRLAQKIYRNGKLLMENEDYIVSPDGNRVTIRLDSDTQYQMRFMGEQLHLWT